MAGRCLAALALTVTLQGCMVGAVVGTVVDVGVEVVKIPFKVGKGVYDAVTEDKKKPEPKAPAQDKPAPAAAPAAQTQAPPEEPAATVLPVTEPPGPLPVQEK